MLFFVTAHASVHVVTQQTKKGNNIQEMAMICHCYLMILFLVTQNISGFSLWKYIFQLTGGRSRYYTATTALVRDFLKCSYLFIADSELFFSDHIAY